MSIISTKQPRLRLPDQVTINFGPPDLLGRAFIQLDRSVRQRGVYLSISDDLQELTEANEQNRQHWYPLPPFFDASLGGLTSDNSFWIRGVDERGDVVLAHACRMYFWPDTTLADELESMRFFYPDPERQRSPGEDCIVEADSPHTLSGRVCYSGAMWLRPDFRGLDLASITPRLTRAYALTRWYPDYIMGMVKTSAVRTEIAAEKYGWRKADKGIRWLGSREGGKELEFAFGWLDRDEVVEDLAQFSSIASVNPADMAVV